jgi:uracil-DNA glycosylase family 4
MTKKLSRKAKTIALEKIDEEIRKCRICKKDKIGIAVPGEGNPDARIVFIGEAPGKKEAVTGKPFIGLAGKVLRTNIKEILGLDDQDVYITSPVKYLPKSGRPTPKEIEHGKIHLFKQLDVIQPDVIVLMGNVAAIAVLGENVKIAKRHGEIITREGRKYFIAFHPAAVLHNPNNRPLLTKDFKKLKKMLNL